MKYRKNEVLNPGHEAALQHIEEAKQLTAELGGTDQDVKEYFFSLSAIQLKNVLNEYGKKYGYKKREYAEETFNNWKHGRTQMSGLVASRLFNLLPPKMPIKKKYELVENLWKHLGPKSRTTYTVGYDVTTDDVINTITDHILKNVTNFVIPKNLKNRFEWLSSGDVSIKQKLLNHLQQIEGQAVVHGANIQIPVLLQHFNSNDGKLTHSSAQEFYIGNHQIRLEFVREHSGITKGSIPRIHNPVNKIRSKSNSDSVSKSDYSWIFWVVLAIIIFFLFA